MNNQILLVKNLAWSLLGHKPIVEIFKGENLEAYNSFLVIEKFTRELILLPSSKRYLENIRI